EPTKASPSRRCAQPRASIPSSSLIRGASPLGLPYTRSRSPLRRLASASAKAPARPRRSASREGGPCAWLARDARSRLHAMCSRISLVAFVNIEDFRRAARRRLTPQVFDYIDGGADGEVTLR